ncbi:MAG: cytochrome c [Myxococcales bacterium]|nr:cytochrome c [Myxococcales bacterium]MCB9670427.1 cytochrome c [Alphaproteobacteria bacterium]
MILALVACATDPALELVGDASSGGELFQAHCALCHGVEADGTSRGPALVAPNGDRAAGDALDAIRFGRGDMPGFPDLSDQDLADLLAWLR